MPLRLLAALAVVPVRFLLVGFAAAFLVAGRAARDAVVFLLEVLERVVVVAFFLVFFFELALVVDFLLVTFFPESFRLADVPRLREVFFPADVDFLPAFVLFEAFFFVTAFFLETAFFFAVFFATFLRVTFFLVTFFFVFLADGRAAAAFRELCFVVFFETRFLDAAFFFGMPSYPRWLQIRRGIIHRSDAGGSLSARLFCSRFQGSVIGAGGFQSG